ncbi:MAG: glutamate ligase domain-containing protein, partial [Stellaceae bacterium]
AERLRAHGAARVVPVSVKGAASGGVYVENGGLIDAIDGAPQRVLDLASIERLPGAHNWQNAAAAYAAARRLRVSSAVATEAIQSFPGLAHRQELVDTIDGVRYINDSKATNADASEKALICYPDIYWIAGGLAKAGGIAPLAPHFGRLRHVFLIGNAMEEFAATLDGNAPLTRCGDLASAVTAAATKARADRVPGAVVLLSPACASFDQFTDFETRGDRFRALVAALHGR